MRKILAVFLVFLIAGFAYGQRKQERGYNVYLWGATGDGTTNDKVAISRVDAWAATESLPLYFPPGTYKIGADLTIASAIEMESGAKFSIDSGKTLTLSGSIQASLDQIFSGSGSVSIGKEGEVYPQWWGAVGDGSNDDTAAIQAAIDAVCPGVSTPSIRKVKLMAGLYLVSGPIILKNWTYLSGEGQRQSRLITSAGFTGHAMIQNFAGTGDPPGSVTTQYFYVDKLALYTSESNTDMYMIWIDSCLETSYIRDINFVVGPGNTVEGMLKVDEVTGWSWGLEISNVSGTYGGECASVGIDVKGHGMSMSRVFIDGGKCADHGISFYSGYFGTMRDCYVEDFPGNDIAAIVIGPNQWWSEVSVEDCGIRTEFQYAAGNTVGIEIDYDHINSQSATYSIKNLAFTRGVVNNNVPDIYIRHKYYDGNSDDYTTTELGGNLNSIIEFSNYARVFKGAALSEVPVKLMSYSMTRTQDSYYQTETVSSTATGGTWTSTFNQSNVDGRPYNVWDADISLWHFGDSATRHNYRVTVHNFNIPAGDEYAVLVSDLGGAINMTATFDVNDSGGYGVHYLTITGTTGSVNFLGNIIWRRSYIQRSGGIP